MLSWKADARAGFKIPPAGGTTLSMALWHGAFPGQWSARSQPIRGGDAGLLALVNKREAGEDPREAQTPGANRILARKALPEHPVRKTSVTCFYKHFAFWKYVLIAVHSMSVTTEVEISKVSPHWILPRRENVHFAFVNKFVVWLPEKWRLIFEFLSKGNREIQLNLS